MSQYVAREVELFGLKPMCRRQFCLGALKRLRTREAKTEFYVEKQWPRNKAIGPIYIRTC